MVRLELGGSGFGGLLGAVDLDPARAPLVVAEHQVGALSYRRMSLHGITSDGWKRYRLGGKWFYEVVELGYKYNLTDVASSIGIVQLEKLDWFDRRRQELATFFRERLSRLPGIGVPQSPDHVHHAWHLFIVDLDEKTAGVDRQTFIERLTEQGVGTSVHFIPVHLHPFYAEHLGHQRGDFPGAEAAFGRAVSLPLYPAMTDDDAEYVVRAVGRALRADT